MPEPDVDDEDASFTGRPAQPEPDVDEPNDPEGVPA
jgi:hypothetical protein